MLKHLRIQHLILIENVEIAFEKGFNVLSGETGAGKSAMMAALALVLGERADTSVIRRGSEKGVVEASFDIQTLPIVRHLLEEAGIDHADEEDLIVRREILATGKSRAFVNNQLAQLTLLRDLGRHLVKFVGQHATHQLFHLEAHREMVDQYGSLHSLTQSFAEAWREEGRVRHQLEELVNSEAKRMRDLEVCRLELEEIQEANLQEGEEEELFAEYSRLNHAEELSRDVHEVVRTFSGEKASVIPLLNRQRQLFDRLLRIDPALKETSDAFQEAFLALQELAYSMQRYQGGIENDPGRMEEVNERLTLINRLKKKYGPAVQDIVAYGSKTREKLQQLENADLQIEELQDRLKTAEKETQQLAQKLSKERKRAAGSLEEAILVHLRSLNMPKVEFSVQVAAQKRDVHGDDLIEFYMAPNTGEHLIPIKDCASGGELSRVLLALHVLLAGKDKIPTLLFDEVDANIGGETAAAVGNKLREIGEWHQVICITHFPQVAARGHQHLQIFKQEIEGRTVTLIRPLADAERQEELQRMVGGKLGLYRT